MAKGLITIIKKEVKEMVRDPRLLLGMIIMPLIMFPIMGLAMSETVDTVEESTRHIQIGVIDLDDDYRAQKLIEHLAERNVTIRDLTEPVTEDMINGSVDEPAIVLTIPHNFTETIDANGMVIVNLSTRLDTFALSESVPTDTIIQYITEYRQLILNERIEDHFPNDNSWDVQYPVLVNSTSIIDGETVDTTPSQITSQLMSQSIMMPMVLMIIIMLAAQLAATSEWGCDPSTSVAASSAATQSPLHCRTSANSACA